MPETNMQKTIRLLSKNRLNSVIQRADFEQPDIGTLTIKTHQDMLSLSGALMVIMASVEIALRNTIYENLNQHFNKKNWFFAPPKPFKWRDTEKSMLGTARYHARRAKYSKMTRGQKKKIESQIHPNRRNYKSHKDRVKRIQNRIPLCDGDIIAELSINFWKSLYAADYEHFLWKQTLRQTFPNLEITRAIVANNLEVIYQTRNRLAHHEPVLFKRFDDSIEAIHFIAQNLNEPEANENSPLAQLLQSDIAKIIKQADKLHAMMSPNRT